ncbi:M4 family metallopeptidase [Halobacillus litoralis]|uniref:M4 family metallopeptidase n=1 Tax=Halobacillus litoralis TaxID=45668 RepID=UPI001CFE0D7C|nr:M4 family metallopeptidase [Halobacillus litoralis]
MKNKKKIISAAALTFGLLTGTGLGAMNVEATANISAKVQEAKQSTGQLTAPSNSKAADIVKKAVKGEIASQLSEQQKNAEPYVDYKVIEDSVDYNGQNLVKVQQTYKGYDVFDKILVTQIDDQGVIKNTLGDIAKNLNGKKGLKDKQKVSKEEAASYVTNTYGSEVETLKDTEVEKIVYVNEKDKAAWAWKVDFSVASPSFAEGFVLIGTHKGDVLLNAVKELDGSLSEDAVQYAKGGGGKPGNGGGGKPGSGATVVGPVQASGVDKNGNARTFTASEMSDGTYQLSDYTRGQGILTYDADYADLNREYRLYPGELLSSTSTTFSDDEGVSAHYLATSVYEYYKNEYNRNSFDNNGQQVKSVVHAWDSSSTNDPENWFNAASVNDGAMLIYGDPLAGAYDVAGHEFTHAVTSSESDLIYSGQSGALNEAISDIFGVAIEKNVNGGTFNWTIGEQSGQIFRSMSDPSSIQFSSTLVYPDDYNDYQELSYDNGGVHFNSSIINKAAYLMAEGGSHNGVNVSGIGEEKTFDLFYYANVDLLTSGATFADLRNAVETVATDLYGSGSAEYQAVTAAFDATLIP